MAHPQEVTTKLNHVFVSLVEAVLGLRVIFELLNADVTNGVVRWVYSMSEPLLAPFRGIYPPAEYSNTYVLDFPVLFAMVAYAVVGYVVFSYVSSLPKPKAVSVFDGKALRKKLR